MFFSFDGVDGTGKSTQIALLAEALRRRGREVVTCRDPGSTPLGERLRPVVDGRYPLEGVPDAMARLASGAARGKQVIEI